MRHAGKIFGAATVSVLGLLLAFTPGSVTKDRLANGSILSNPAHAQTSDAMARHLAKINAADDAYFKAAIAIETAGESPERLNNLKKADDSYFEAVIAFEAASAKAIQLAKIQAADDAYFKAAMAIETGEQQIQQLAQLKAQENAAAPTMLAQQSDDQLTTASIPGGKDSIASQLAKVKAADDAYFDAVIAIETSGENAEDLAKLKKADDAYFDAVIALDLAFAEQAAAKKAGKKVKVAAASSGTTSDAMAKAPVAVTGKAPLPAKKRWSKPRAAKKMKYKKVRTAKAVPQQQQIKGPLGVLLAPITLIFGSAN